MKKPESVDPGNLAGLVCPCSYFALTEGMFKGPSKQMPRNREEIGRPHVSLSAVRDGVAESNNYASSLDSNVAC